MNLFFFAAELLLLEADALISRILGKHRFASGATLVNARANESGNNSPNVHVQATRKLLGTVSFIEDILSERLEIVQMRTGTV